MNPDVRAHLVGVCAALDGITAGSTAVPVHQVAVPDDTTLPYLIVTPSPGGFLNGTIAAPDTDGELIFLVIAAAVRREGGMGAQQAVWLQQQARDRLLAGVAVEGWTVMRVRLDIPGGVIEDTDVAPHRFFTVDRFALHTTPADPTT